ncbi:hypothetical protein U0070_014716, partial [Myodes glareolus]
SILSFWHISIIAHEITGSLPHQVIEGENVLLLVHNLPDNGSLLIENITQKDTGIYTLWTYNRSGKIASTTSMYLHVHSNFSLEVWAPWYLFLPTFESFSHSVTKGRSVLLLVHNHPENIVGFVCFKGMTMFKNIVVAQYTLGRKSTAWGPAYGGRETLYSDGSLLFHDVTQKSHGLHTLRLLRADMRREETQVQLQIHKDAKAFSWYTSISRTQFHKIVEYSRAKNSITWEPAHRRQRMGVTEEDAGIYTLSVLNKDSIIESAHVKFYVK